MDNRTREVVAELVYSQLASLRVLSTLISAVPEGGPLERLQALLGESTEHLEAAVRVLNDG